MLLRFFEHHGFLQRRQLAWLTVTGGSRAYVEAVGRRLADRVRLDAPVRRVERTADGVLVTAGAAGPQRFDAVVLACHADESLAALADPTPQERVRLSRFGYARHRVLLHTDPTFLPQARAAWSSWNCDLHDCRDETAPVSVTYHLNRLQSLPTATPFCVTLNADREPRGVLAEMAYAHPLLTADAVAAQDEVAAAQGERGTWFAGAHLRHGFHEDGVESAHRVVAALGCAE
jgi:predicted NAD/FAD-binding protein